MRGWPLRIHKTEWRVKPQRVIAIKVFSTSPLLFYITVSKVIEKNSVSKRLSEAEVVA